MVWRRGLKNRAPARSGSPWRAGRSSVRPASAKMVSNSAPKQLLVGGALTGVIVGIAAQQPLSNLFAGLVLLITRPLAVGQWVRIHSGALGGPLEGSVIEMGLIYTTLSTEHEILHIPNSGLLNA